MPDEVVIVGGTSGIGRELARRFADRGDTVVVTGRDADRAQDIAAAIGSGVRGLGVDLCRPRDIAGRLSDVGNVKHLVLAAIDRDQNSVRDYDLGSALALVTLKLVGYTEVVHALADRLLPSSSVLVFGGQAKERPYPGSTTVTTVNGGVVGLVRTMAVELSPVRVNGVHPGIVGDSPAWRERPAEVLEGVRARTPTRRLVTMEDVVGACVFLLENASVDGVNLEVDGGWLLL
jgi:NAD(P)-dependent dehydrogenase (short-subunit alcohol dehydrogenase family)